MKMINFLQGKKSYIIAMCVGLVAVAQHLGYIDSSVALTLYGLLGAGGVGSLRAAIAKK